MKLSRKEILEKLQDIMISVNENDKDKILECGEDARLVEDIGLNSVGVIYLVLLIESAFQIKFEDVSVNTFKTVGQVIDYIEGK